MQHLELSSGTSVWKIFVLNFTSGLFWQFSGSFTIKLNIPFLYGELSGALIKPSISLKLCFNNNFTPIQFKKP